MSDLTMIFTLMGMFSLLMLAMTIYQKKNTVPFVKTPLPRPVVWLFWVALSAIFFAFAFRAAPDVRAPNGTTPASYILLEQRTARILEPLAPPLPPELPDLVAEANPAQPKTEAAATEDNAQKAAPSLPPSRSMLFAENKEIEVPEFVIAPEFPARIHGYTLAYTLSSAARHYAQTHNLPVVKVTMLATAENKAVPLVLGETIYAPALAQENDEQDAWYMVVNQRSLLPNEVMLLNEMEANASSYMLADGTIDKDSLEKAISEKLSSFFTAYTLPKIHLDPIYVMSSKDVPVTAPTR